MSSQAGLDVKKQLDIEWRNRKDNENLSAIGTIIQWFPNENTAKSQPPFKGQYKGFKFILEYLDNFNLYGFRYSFEKDYKSRVLIDFSPVFLRIFIETLTDISNNLTHLNN